MLKMTTEKEFEDRIDMAENLLEINKIIKGSEMIIDGKIIDEDLFEFFKIMIQDIFNKIIILKDIDGDEL